MLPELTLNRHFMTAFVEAEPPCVALSLVEIASSPSALIALRFSQPIPKSVISGGFAFGHALLGGNDWEVVHLAFTFYGFASYNALINPSNPIARSVLTTMVETGGYFVFALDSDRSTTASAPILGQTPLPGYGPTWRAFIRRSRPTPNTAPLSLSLQPTQTLPGLC